jgi:hypothetical protein
MVCVGCDGLAKERGKRLWLCNHTCILQCVNGSSSCYRLAIRTPFGARTSEPKTCDGSIHPMKLRSPNLGTSEALDASLRPLLLDCRLLLRGHTDPAEVITRALANQNSLKRSARRR